MPNCTSLNGENRTMNDKGLIRITLSCLGLLLLGLVFVVMPAVAQEETPEPPVYEVQPGDTLYAIALRFDSTVEAIVEANNIEDARLIHVGQQLVIPTANPDLVPSVATNGNPNRRLHPVRDGETLPSLAFQYKTTIWALQQTNKLSRLGFLEPGQGLIIPEPVAIITGTPTFPTITASPAPVIRGKTMVVEVETDSDVALSGSFMGQELAFWPNETGYWTLVGVGALTPGGTYPIRLNLTETVSGDLLTVVEDLAVGAGDYPTYNIVVPDDRQSLLAPAIVTAERKKVNAAFAGRSNTQLWAGAFGPPLATELTTTAPFGQRRSYNGGPVSSYHSGEDYRGAAGTPIYAPAKGTVVMAEPLDVRGQVVILDHGLGVYTGFWHMSQLDVAEGQMVERGQIVGLVGNTGLSTGPHLHWEMRVGGIPVDPEQWLGQAFP
jgi:murein DD-endopeptidase MepM/ murein hydrolase activator NlpD